MDEMAIKQLYVAMEENHRDSRCLKIFKIPPQIGHPEMYKDKMGDNKNQGSKDESMHLHNKMLMFLTQW